MDLNNTKENTVVYKSRIYNKCPVVSRAKQKYFTIQMQEQIKLIHFKNLECVLLRFCH